MNVRLHLSTHKHARRLLHIPAEHLTEIQKIRLANHLEVCQDCRAYAETVQDLQPVLARAMHLRWDNQAGPVTSSRSIQKRWKHAQRKQHASQLAVMLAGIGVVVLFFLYGQPMFAALFSWLLDRNNIIVPLPTQPAVIPDVARTPETVIQPTTGDPEAAAGQFLLTVVASDPAALNRGLFLIAGSGGGILNLAKSHGFQDVYHPLWSPDGSRIAFLDCPGLSSAGGNNMLYIISRDGSTLTSMENLLGSINVSPSCGDDSISWSPDGRRIAFEGTFKDYPYHADIFIVSASGDRIENLTENIWSAETGQSGTAESMPDWTAEHFPLWSPDGSRLAMVAGGDIYIINLDGTSLVRLTQRSGDAKSLNWTPDGQAIIYGDDSYSAILSVSVESGAIQTVLPGGEHDEYDPDLSPDGSQIAYYNGYGGIYVVDLSGQNARQIITTEAFSPSWSPDGKLIAYKRPVNDGAQLTWELSVVSRNGSWSRDLVELALGNNELSWSYTMGTNLVAMTQPTIDPGLAGTPEPPTQPTQTAPELTPPDSQIVYLSGELIGPDAVLDIYATGVREEEVKNLTESHGIQYPLNFSVSPDGERIAFIDCGMFMEGANQRNKMYVMRKDGTDLLSMELIFNEMVINPDCSPLSWSPDNQRIAFTGACSNCFRDIFIVSADGDSLENVTENLIYEDLILCQGVGEALYQQCQGEKAPESNPVWSSDGNSLAVVIDKEIYILGVDGASERRLTDQEGEPYGIAWTPDSKQIIFSNYDGDGQIYSLSVDNGEMRRIGEGEELDLSPDGTQIVFTRSGKGIYVMDLSGQNLTLIIAGVAYSPRWSPDGRFIVYQKSSGNGNALWIAAKDGSWEKMLVEASVWNNAISWVR